MKFPDVGGVSRGGAGGSGGLYVRLADGERIQGVFRGSPSIFRLHWANRQSTRCEGKDRCALCQGGDKPKFRFAINFITKEDGVWVAKIFEQGYLLYKKLKDLHENDYNLEETAVNVSRTGEELETEYNVLPAKNNGGLTAKDFKAIAAVPLNRLSEEKPEDPADASGDANEDVPF